MTKIQKMVWGAAGLGVALFPAALWAYYYGPDVRNTAAPGDDPMACATSGCHTSKPAGGPVNTAGGSVSATFSSGSTYTPGGAPVTITVTARDPNPANTHFGFQMSARLAGNPSFGQAGHFTPGPDQILMCDNTDNLAPSSGCGNYGKGDPHAGLPVVEFIEHYFSAYNFVYSTSKSYVFTWTPPATNVGNVIFYLAGNVVNFNNQADSGDHVYTANYTLTPLAQCTNTSLPTIESANSASGFGGGTNFAAGSWLEIKGTNLASTTRQWTGNDFTGSNAPTSLDGVSVLINGKPGYIYYVNNELTQVNVQAPADTAMGPVSITVTNCNTTSASASLLTKAPLVPGLLAPSSFNIGGKQYLVALFLDGVTYVGNTNLIPGLPFRPAKPGDTIVTYGIGFGDVTPAVAPGVIVSQSNQLVNPVTILFGTTQAQTTYAGLAPGQIGVYQFNITVPNVPDGDYSINVTQNGITALPSTMYLTVHK
jgi:uncharacterized protein (TIGR03437 family)